MTSVRRQSLAGRLLVTYAVTVVVVLGLLGFLVERFAREALLEGVEYGLEEQAYLVAEAISRSDEAVAAVVEGLAPQVDARVTVVDADGVVLADSHADPAQMENHGQRPEVADAYRGEVGVDRRVSATTGFAQTYVAIPGPDGQVVRLSLPANVVNAPIGEFRGRLIWIVAVAAVVGVVVVGLVARLLARPLGRLSEATSEIAAGDLEVDVPRAAVAELDDLARSIQQMEDELGARIAEAESERLTLGVVLDALPQGTLLVGADDRIVYANRSVVAMLGPVPDGLEGVVPFRIQEVVRRAREQGESVDVDTEHGRPARILRIIAEPFEDGRALVVVSDVTERRRVDDVRRDFVTNASHELKTPVASILAAAETLQVALERAPERVGQFAGQIEVSARSLSRLVSDLLDLSRLESRTSERHQLDLAEVVAREVATVAPRAEERGVELESHVEAATVIGSDADLGLAVRNLLDNALRYTDPGGRVTVRLERQGTEAVLAVSDTGVGIPQRDLGRVFERFYRIDEARSRATGGTGLGLSIVRHVVEAHGGEVSVDSELGAGSTFTVRLPVAVPGSGDLSPVDGGGGE
ncbi:MAG: ATP-binding protein [Actinomycetota bacterium]